MANGIFNVARGRIVEFYNRVESNDPANAAFIIVALQANEAEATLVDRDDLSALLAITANTEATFTNYARKTLTDSELDALPAPDDANDRRDLDIPDQTWASAGGATNNTLTKLLVAYDNDTGAGTDANIIPCTHQDFAVTTDGNDLTGKIDSAGFYRSGT